MESRPQNPEFRNNPENFHPCTHLAARRAQSNMHLQLFQKSFSKLGGIKMLPSMQKVRKNNRFYHLLQNLINISLRLAKFLCIQL